MAVKTITITEGAYEALKARKEKYESFSELALRLAGKRPLSEFIGILSEKSAKELESAIMGNRARHRKSYEERMKRITKSLGGADGSS